MLRLLYTAVFFSGASALIYQVVWHRYLGILLGSHARATAVVLAVFLGGLGLGYALFGGRSSRNTRTLLQFYGNIEVALALFALAFPLTFRLAFAAAPGMDLAFGINSMATDLLLATFLIGAPAVLMGATLPLMTQALSDDLKGASLIHARIYGFNTVGAAAGGLLAGYLLVPLFGLSFSLRMGAILNLTAALMAYSRAKRFPEINVERRSKTRPTPFFAGFAKLSPDQLRLAGIGFLSGFYVLTLETLLIRLMGLSAGSSEYHFSLIVSIFIFGLGFSPLLARRIKDFTIGHLFWNQIAVTVLMLLVYLSGDLWPYAAHRIRIPFRDIAQNYYPYQAALGAALAAFLILPVGACGLTLPICFHLFKDDPKRLGQHTGFLYSANTVGSVLGGLIGGYALFYVANIDTIFKVVVSAAAATVFIAAGLRTRGHCVSGTGALSGFGIASLALVWGLVAAPYEKNRFVEPFRTNHPIKASFEGPGAFEKFVSRNVSHIFYSDGPNTSIGIGADLRKDGKESARVILVNGKSDGSTKGPDTLTTKLLGHIPALLAKNPERAAVIGFGTGMTVGALDLHDEVRSIDIIEISPILIREAGLFDAYNGRVTRSPKVAFHEMDAFRYFRGTPRKFDIIVSEPSNPWVSGVENLYSEEFFRTARGTLDEDGLFVQWLHSYGMNEKLFRGILRTMNGVFPHITVFQLAPQDYAIVGHSKSFTVEVLARAHKRFVANPAVRRSFKSIDIDDFLALPALEILPPQLTRSMGKDFQPQTLEKPYLSHLAAITFFSRESTKVEDLARNEPNYFSTVEESLFQRYIRARPPTAAQWDSLRNSSCDSGETGGLPRVCRGLMILAAAVPEAGSLQESEKSNIHPEMLKIAKRFSNPSTARKGNDRLREITEMFDFILKNFSPIARLPLTRLNRRIDVCIRSAGPADLIRGECLVHKLILAKLMDAPEKNFLRHYDRYLAWFDHISPEFPEYASFLIIRENANAENLKTYLNKALSRLPAK